jgi:hypothetical protein
MATLQGYKIVWGSGVALTAGFVTASKLYPQSAELSISGGDVEIADDQGEAKARNFFNDKIAFNVTMIPFDATTQIAAATNFDMPARGTKCTATAATSIQAAGAVTKYAGDYMFISGSLRLRNDGVSEIQAVLERQPGITPS